MDSVGEFYTQGIMEETNLQHFIDPIGGYDPISNFCLNYDYDYISGCFDDTQFGPNLRDNLLDDFTFGSALSGLPLVDGDEMEVEEKNDVGEESSATTNMMTPKKKKGDRSRTLISERRRRGRMKEKLYALRALVPNITKMDKASIVGDAVIYVQELQMQAKNLRAEIAALESSLTVADKQQKQTTENQKNLQFSDGNQQICKKILQMAIFHIEERGVYVRMEIKRSQGVGVSSLYKALESLTRFSVQSSNMATLGEKFILTFAMKVRESEPNINLEILKLWVARAFLNQGFVFQAQQSD